MLLNLKKHEKELTEIGHNFAVTYSGEVMKCNRSTCEEAGCIFLDEDLCCCDSDRLEWLFKPVYNVKQFTGIEISLLYVIGEGDIIISRGCGGRKAGFNPRGSNFTIDLAIFNCEFKPLPEGIHDVTELKENICGMRKEVK